MLHEVRALLSDYLSRVARCQSETLLFIVYWTVVAASALMMRLFGRRLLPDTYGRTRSHWITRAPLTDARRNVLRQF